MPVRVFDGRDEPKARIDYNRTYTLRPGAAGVNWCGRFVAAHRGTRVVLGPGSRVVYFPTEAFLASPRAAQLRGETAPPSAPLPPALPQEDAHEALIAPHRHAWFQRFREDEAARGAALNGLRGLARVEAAETAVHEAGHAVLAIVVGGAVKRVSMRPQPESLGRSHNVLYRGAGTLAEVAVLVAGAAAVELYGGEEPQSRRSVDDESAAAVASSLVPSARVPAFISEVRARVARVLRTRVDFAVRRVAIALVERMEIDGDLVEQLVAKHAPDAIDAWKREDAGKRA